VGHLLFFLQKKITVFFPADVNDLISKASVVFEIGALFFFVMGVYFLANKLITKQSNLSKDST